MKRKDLFLTLGSLAISSGCHAGAGTWSSTRTVEVADPQYQMTAFSIAVPAGWKYAGTVARDPGCHANGAALKQTMQTPDGQFALVVLPGFAWAWSTDPTMRDIMQKPTLRRDRYRFRRQIPGQHRRAEFVSQWQDHSGAAVGS